MVEFLAGETAVASAWRVLKPFAGLLAVAAIGAAAAETYEQKVPWGLAAGKSRAEAADRADAALAASRLDLITNPKTGWKAALDRCEAARKRETDAGAARIGSETEARAQASSDAFDKGYAAGRVAGARTCGAPHETTSSPPGGGQPRPGAGGVRPSPAHDFAGDWARGAYRAEGAVSGGR